MDQAPNKMNPGDDMHLTLLMAPHSLNFVTGQDRKHLLAFGRAAFEAGQKCQGCAVAQGTNTTSNTLAQIQEPATVRLDAQMLMLSAVTSGPARSMLQEGAYRIAELEAQLEAIGAGGVEPLRKPVQAVEPELVVEMSRQIAELQDQLAAVQHGVQPYAVLAFERGEEGPFDRKPVKPGSVQHLHAKRDPHYDCIELYTHPTPQGLEQDAARYRALCSSGAYAPSSFRTAPWGLVTGITHSQGKAELDAAVDAYIAAQAKQGEQA